MAKTEKQKLGRLGEGYACRYLENEQYRILELNWRYRRTEVDIIAMEGDVMVFVEVKTRTQDYFGSPASTVEDAQQGRLSRAAGAYMEQTGHDWEIRFDIIGILIEENGDYQLEHIKDAWWPGL
ncbi:MAG: YraN family protein [Bacteroidota bacterium]